MAEENKESRKCRSILSECKQMQMRCTKLRVSLACFRFWRSAARSQSASWRVILENGTITIFGASNICSEYERYRHTIVFIYSSEKTVYSIEPTQRRQRRSKTESRRLHREGRKGEYRLRGKTKLGSEGATEIMSFKIHEARSADGRSAVHCLARRGCVDKYHGIVDRPTTSLINFFLKNSTENLIDEEGYSYLHGACFVGNIEAVQRFVGEGVDVNLDTYECSPLHIAVQYRRADVVKFLLDLGADPNQRDREQSTPLHRLSWLYKCDCGPSDYTCDKRNPANLIVKMLTDKGASMDARDSSEQTPLDVAVSKCDLELSKSLLEYGASQDTLNNNVPINWNSYLDDTVSCCLIKSNFTPNFFSRTSRVKPLRSSCAVFICKRKLCLVSNLFAHTSHKRMCARAYIGPRSPARPSANAPTHDSRAAAAALQHTHAESKRVAAQRVKLRAIAAVGCNNNFNIEMYLSICALARSAPGAAYAISTPQPHALRPFL
ncbi:unnamed protein product [Trichogramma brassicae]|uniref:Uncharacterized protein n=1 Tax=Trichogramma brassicae TaxID=86971 RepID=A0A6H5IIQ7_9HYME|nr:unnamed protein product [Trichogramma brassicae]